ncbi:MAG TPA: T9SS type A sorting domain-containing protein, partial [Chitinophagales bacterium]|nr:T9SS type A sorting domain-containing protein [Chitinophagales bacterium]
REIGETKKAAKVFQPALQDKMQLHFSLPAISDTIQLPNVDVTEKESSSFSGTLGGMIYRVSTIGFEVSDSLVDSAALVENDSPALIKSVLQDELSIFPNPSNGPFQIHYRISKSSPLEIFVFNLSGQFARKIFAVNELQPGEYTEQVELTDAPAGIYFVRVQMKDNALTRKVIITH